MATNLFTGAQDDIIAQGVLRGFTAGLTPLTAFSTDFSSDAAKKGNTVSVIRDDSTVTAVTTKTSGSDYSMQNTSSDAVDITLNKHPYVSTELSDTDIANSSVINLEMFGRRKGHLLAKYVLDDASNGIWSVITDANYGTAAFVGAATDFDADDVVDVMDACDDADWPQDSRSLILSNAYYSNLLKDNAIQSSAAFGGAEAIREGRIPNLAGFDVYKSNIIPANGENLVGFAANRGAIAVAFRFLEPDAGHKYESVERLTDPESGITIGVRTWYDENSGTKRRVYECLYGFVAGLEENTGTSSAIKRITSA